MRRYKPRNESQDDFDINIGPFSNSCDRELYKEREKRKIQSESPMKEGQEDDFDKGFMHIDY